MSLPILILKHPNGLNNQDWNFILLTRHREVSHQFILDNPKLPWNHTNTKSDHGDDEEIVSCLSIDDSKSLLESSIDKHDTILRILSDRMMDVNILDWLNQHYSVGGLKMLPWTTISRCCILSIELIDRYCGYLMIDKMSYNQSLTVEIFDHINDIRSQGGMFGSSLSSDIDVLAIHNRWNMSSVGRYILLTVDFIDQYKNQLDIRELVYNWNPTWEVANHIVKIYGSKHKGWISHKLPPILDEIKKNSSNIDLDQWLRCRGYDKLNWDIVDYLETRIDLTNHWNGIIRRIPLTEPVIINHRKKMNRANLSLNRSLTLSMIKLYDSLNKNEVSMLNSLLGKKSENDDWNWKYISRWTIMNGEIVEFKNQLNIKQLSYNSSVSYQFILDHQHWGWDSDGLSCRSYKNEKIKRD